MLRTGSSRPCHLTTMLFLDQYFLIKNITIKYIPYQLSSLYTSVMEWAKPSPDVELMNLASIEDINFNSGSDSLLRCQVTTPAVTRYWNDLEGQRRSYHLLTGHRLRSTSSHLIPLALLSPSSPIPIDS